MAESVHMGSGGNRERAAHDGAMGRKMDMLKRPQTDAAPSLKLALSHPDRGVIAEDVTWKSASLQREITYVARPGSATSPGLRLAGMPDLRGDASISSPTQKPPRIFGRVSCYDQVNENKEAHSYLGEQNEQSG